MALVLQDGRELVCTPDHEILTADGHWLRADQLEPGRDRVVVGLEAPLDEPPLGKHLLGWGTIVPPQFCRKIAAKIRGRRCV